MTPLPANCGVRSDHTGELRFDDGVEAVPVTPTAGGVPVHAVYATIVACVAPRWLPGWTRSAAQSTSEPNPRHRI